MSLEECSRFSQIGLVVAIDLGRVDFGDAEALERVESRLQLLGAIEAEGAH